MTTTPAPEPDELLPHGSFADEVDEDGILARAAAILAARGEKKPEIEPVPPTSIDSPTLIHVLAQRVYIGDTGRRDHGFVIEREHKRGDELMVSPKDVTTVNMRNRDGSNNFDKMLERGDIALGPKPSYIRPWLFGSQAWREARAAAVAKARALPDAIAASGALQAVAEHFGAAEFTPESAEKFYEALRIERHGKDEGASR